MPYNTLPIGEVISINTNLIYIKYMKLVFISPDVNKTQELQVYIDGVDIHFPFHSIPKVMENFMMLLANKYISAIISGEDISLYSGLDGEHITFLVSPRFVKCFLALNEAI